MGGSLSNRQQHMTTLEDKLSEGERDEVEQAAEESEAEKEQRRREERRNATKYGAMLNDE